tara:strand:+ start:1189 stop:1365 length:177 start_codon:yes stop_codon:yes gene_type:complete
MIIKMPRKLKDEVKRRTGSIKKKIHYEKMGKYKKNIIKRDELVEPIVYSPRPSGASKK